MSRDGCCRGGIHGCGSFRGHPAFPSWPAQLRERQHHPDGGLAATAARRSSLKPQITFITCAGSKSKCTRDKWGENKQKQTGWCILPGWQWLLIPTIPINFPLFIYFPIPQSPGLFPFPKNFSLISGSPAETAFAKHIVLAMYPKGEGYLRGMKRRNGGRSSGKWNARQAERTSASLTENTTTEEAVVEAFVSLRFCRSSGVMGQVGYTGAKDGGACEQAQAVP